MKGNLELIAILNDLLSDEVTAVSQYMLHSTMCDNWGFKKLHDAVEKRSIDEMKHAEILMERILFLEGTPVIDHLKKIHVGALIDQQFKNDHDSEVGAVSAYNKAIGFASEKQDFGTQELLKGILKDEERHLDWLETQLELISQMGLQNYLSLQAE
jgi:bacterioferritin